MARSCFTIRFCVSLLLLIFIGGCASTGPQHEMLITLDMANSLIPQDKIAVSVPKDGKYETKIYAGSGMKTSEAALRELEKYSNDVKIIDCAPSECSDVAGDAGFAYLVKINILHWEDRQTSWSGRRDRLTLEFNVIDVKENRTISSAILTGTGTWMTLGGEHVEDELSDTLEAYVASLFGVSK